MPPIIPRAEPIIARLPIPISATDEDNRIIIPHVLCCLGFLNITIVPMNMTIPDITPRTSKIAFSHFFTFHFIQIAKLFSVST